MNHRTLRAFTQDLCLTCMEPIRTNFESCQRCSESRYCSTNCLEEDKQEHRKLCDFILLSLAIEDHFGSILYHRDNERDTNNSASLDNCDTSNGASRNICSDNNSCANSNNNNMTKLNRKEAESAHSNAQTQSESGPESFGKGWWKGREETAEKPETDDSKSKLKRSLKKHGCTDEPPAKTQKKETTSSASSLKTTTVSSGENFGSGWWKGPLNKARDEKEREKSKSPLKRSASDRILGEEPSAKTPKKASITSSQTSTTNSGQDFGTGWWKGRTLGENKKQESETSSREGTDAKASVEKSDLPIGEQNSQSKSSSGQNVAEVNTVDQLFSINHQCMTIEMSKMCLSVDVDGPERKNNCTDIVLRQNTRSKELDNEYRAVLKDIVDSPEIMREEEQHGRMIVTSFRDIPCLYRASLGGSRLSIVVKIISSYKGFKNTVLVQDHDGVTSPVVFDIPFNEDTRGCLKPENFVLLPGAFWEVLPDSYLGIRVTDEDGCHFFEKALEHQSCNIM